MSVILQQYTVPSSSTVAVFAIPPGYFYATMYSTAASALYLGTSTGVSATNGFVMHTVPVSFQGSMTSRAAQVYAANPSGAALTFNLFMITDQ